ncbi:MAG: helix-turn-helix transcriptional regulator [Solirubrobacteraceae bacterium]
MPAPRGDRAARVSLSGVRVGFFGRAEELVELRGLLERGRRLVTLAGAPGVGKTRLARELTERHPHDAAVVDLAAVSDPALVERSLAFALSVQEVPGQSLIDSVIDHLRRRPLLLLVLDNCEHLIGACRDVVASLRAGACELLIVATSRQPLGVDGESVWQVAPLAVPKRGEALLPEVLMSYPAVCLFVERAGAVQPGFALNSYVASAVVEVCRRLDGIPLAIELAAARVDMLTPAELATRLDDRFDLLTGGSGGAVGRHGTLEAALGWSYRLLSRPERALLRRLSVFVGGFHLEAAEAVCADEKVEAGAVRDLLAALVSKSLVVVDVDTQSGGRYRLLETIGSYASDRLERAGEAAALREAHARFYLALAEEAEPELTGPGQAEVLERLDGERDNLRRSLEWSLGHAHGEWALRLAGALVLFWRVRCHFSEGKELLEAALEASGAGAPVLRARALWGVGFMAMMTGDAEAAVAPLAQSLAIFRREGDLGGCARALLIIANANQYRAGAGVLALLEESAELAARAGDRWCLAHALGVAGFEHVKCGDLPAARVVLGECLAVARESHDDQGLRIGLVGLGSVAVEQGDYREAKALLEEALAISCELEERYSKAEALQYLGWLALNRGDVPGARDLIERASAVSSEPAVVDDIAGTLLLGRAAHVAGDRGGARRRFAEVLARASPAPPIMALQCAGDLAVDEGNLDEGRRLLERALAQARGIGQRNMMASALHGLGLIARDAGNTARATERHHEALELQRGIGAAPAIVASVEALAGLAVAGGRDHDAARLLGAATALRRDNGYARLPWESARHGADIEDIRGRLSGEELKAALAQGSGLSIEQAAAEAAGTSAPPARPAGDWSSLTAAEQRVAVLAAEGLTNAQIAERLCITAGTVKNHLSHIFAKLGVRTRTEVARESWRQERPPPGSR